MLVAVPKQAPCLRGPIPPERLSMAASLPVKTLTELVCITVAGWRGKGQRASHWLSPKALKTMNVGRDTESAGPPG
jgi:hypothetical protein